ncbi:hypothetical protein [Miltoncostaea marina]|uniref:hypothetical protein n=1 Tax=Miltoncostaea marina TaxID=2843215 RepID=UPI001C3C3BA6|nr:hypothetical protein [Miltoncostaea marina]
MSAHDERIPESVREYFGHDRVAHHGRGGMPAAPPAPPGSTARKAGQNAVADALSKVGAPGRRPGDRPAVVPPRPKPPRLMRSAGERALMTASQRRFSRAARGPEPHGGAGWFWDAVFAPVYARIPWPVKRRMVSMTSGVKRWRS